MHYMAAGESNGTSLVAIVSDVPAGLRLHEDAINADLSRWAHGRGKEDLPADSIHILTGVEGGRTTGAPVTLFIDNTTYLGISDEANEGSSSTPRPGTSELVGALKMDMDDCAVVAHRDSLRADAIRVAAACVARELLADFGVEVHSYVTRIGEAAMRESAAALEGLAYAPLDIETSSVRCPSSQATRAMEAALDSAKHAGDTLGGEFALVATGVVSGLGSFTNPAAGMTARLSAAVFAARGVMGIEFGKASQASRMRGFDATDAVCLAPGAGFSRETNMAGGIEGGMTTGMPIVMRATVAPSVRFGIPVPSMDMATLDYAFAQSSSYEPCLAPSSAVAAEAEVAFALANAYLEKFGGDAMADIHASLAAYERRLKQAAR